MAALFALHMGGVKSPRGLAPVGRRVAGPVGVGVAGWLGRDGPEAWRWASLSLLTPDVLRRRAGPAAL